MTLRMRAEAETSLRWIFTKPSLVVLLRGGGTWETSVDSGGARSESVCQCHREKGLVKLKNNRWFIRRLLFGISRDTLSCYVLIIPRVAAIRWTSQRAVFPKMAPCFEASVLKAWKGTTPLPAWLANGHACNCILSSQGSCSTPLDLQYSHLYISPLHGIVLQSRLYFIALC